MTLRMKDTEILRGLLEDPDLKRFWSGVDTRHLTTRNLENSQNEFLEMLALYFKPNVGRERTQKRFVVLIEELLSK